MVFISSCMEVLFQGGIVFFSIISTHAIRSAGISSAGDKQNLTFVCKKKKYIYYYFVF